MKNKKMLFVMQSLLGAALLVAGFWVINADEYKMLSGLCIGIGAAMTALGVGQLIQALIVPTLEMETIKKQKEIDINDERNIRIKEKSGYKTAQIMNYVLSGYILILGFMGVALPLILLAVALLVIEFALVIYFSNHYAREL